MKHIRARLPNDKAGGKPSWFQIEAEVSGGWSELFSLKLPLQNDNLIIANTKLMWHKLHRAGRWDFSNPLMHLYGITSEF